MRAHHYALVAVVLFVAAVLAFLLLTRDSGRAPVDTPSAAVADSSQRSREVIPPPTDIASVERESGAEARRVAASDAGGLRLYGTVRNESGHALPAVRIIPPGLSGQVVPNYYTEADGTYDFAIQPLSGRDRYDVSFVAEGYEPFGLRLSVEDLQQEALQRDIQLAIMGERAEVSGTLVGLRGEGIEGLHIQFYSTSLGERYDASTDRYGAFALPQVKPGADYQLLIQPEEGYRDYIERNIVVPAQGLAFEIVLESLGAGRLSGRLVDPEGRPIANMPFTVRSDRSVRVPIQASSDSSGYFSVDDVPAGRLTFSAEAGSSVKVRGVGLDPGEAREVVLVLDWGQHSMTGRVVDDRGNPVAGAQVAISWMQMDGGVRSSSTRTAATDSDGSFRFEKLGPGPHRVDVTARGHQSVGGDYKSGSTLELRLPRQDS